MKAGTESGRSEEGSDSLRVCLLEPFFGGSHRAFAEGWVRHSRHRIDVVALPPRFWKWRMRGAAFELARRLRESLAEEPYEVLFATNLLDLAHLQALLPRPLPAILFFHENQVSYPGRPDGEAEERDLQFAFTDLASALAADRVAFNSAFQRDAFLQDLRGLLARMPDARPLWAVDEIRRKSSVAPLGVELSDIPPREPASAAEPPLILWNHRWEYDKAPEVFFGVLGRLAEKGAKFRVAVAGESFSKAPRVFGEARRLLGERVQHWGYVPDRKGYVSLLARCDYVVSTALQENFGLSVVEAAYAGAHPLVPSRLSYPEVLPRELHRDCLYETAEQLEARLDALLAGRSLRLPPGRLRAALSSHAWEERVALFDGMARQVFGGEGTRVVV